MNTKLNNRHWLQLIHSHVTHHHSTAPGHTPDARALLSRVKAYNRSKWTDTEQPYRLKMPPNGKTHWVNSTYKCPK